MKEIEMILPQDIEKRSFEIIEAELQQMNIVLPQEQEAITKRVIHTSADFSYAETMTYAEGAISHAIALLQIRIWQRQGSIKRRWRVLVEKYTALWQTKQWHRRRRNAVLHAQW